MKTILLNNVLSDKELFFMYNEIVSSPGWRLNGISSDEPGFNYGPVLVVKNNTGIGGEFNPFYYWGQSVVYRIFKLLEEKNIGMPTTLHRMWFNSTYNGKKTQHFLHRDDDKTGPINFKSILIFMTPIWQPDWKGSFYVDGQEFKFRPGSAIVFDSEEYHKGESPDSEMFNWQRITCNIMVK